MKFFEFHSAVPGDNPNMVGFSILNYLLYPENSFFRLSKNLFSISNKFSMVTFLKLHQNQLQIPWRSNKPKRNFSEYLRKLSVE